LSKTRRGRRVHPTWWHVGVDTSCHDTTQTFSARRLRREGELEPPSAVIYPISRFLSVGIDVREPANATPHDILQVDAVLIQKMVVCLQCSIKFSLSR